MLHTAVWDAWNCSSRFRRASVMVDLRGREPCCGEPFPPRLPAFRRWPWCPLVIQAKPTIVELSMDKLEEILRRLEAKELDADDYETIKAVIGAYVYLFNAVGDKETTIRRLRQMLFGVKTEKTAAVVGGLQGVESASASPQTAAEPPAAAEAEARAGSHEGWLGASVGTT